MNFIPHPYLPRALTCVVVGLLLSLTVFIPSGTDDGKQHLYLSTAGRTDDIERAVQSLGRSDIAIHHGGTGPFQMDVFEGWIFILILGTLISAVGWAGISFIYTLICKTLETRASP